MNQQDYDPFFNVHFLVHPSKKKTFSQIVSIQWQLKSTLLKIHLSYNIEYSLGNDDIQGYNSRRISNRKIR